VLILARVPAFPPRPWCLLLFLGCSWSRPPATALPAEAERPPPASALRSAEDFRGLPEPDRSRALFAEINRVLSHPRCANCHPDGDSPLQAMDSHLHDPPVLRGPEDRGVVGMKCTGCHQEHNLELARVPGAPGWHLAPIEMAWVGKSPHHICEQIKDPKRNGGKTLQQIHHHLAHDELVAWGWHPGHGREPAPGTQAELGVLTEAWIASGAHCPQEAP
jgi:hypothetical protein